MSIDWSKAPEGATHRCNLSWYKNNGGNWFYWSDTSCLWHATPYLSPEDCSWWCSNVPRPGQWTGEGLPPVGTVCELSQSVLLADEETSDWFETGTQVEVGGHANFHGSAGPVCTICVVDSNFTGTLSEACLRPIRTPEQIAAEERNDAQRDIKHIILTAFSLDPVTASSIAGVLADSQYRKVTQ